MHTESIMYQDQDTTLEAYVAYQDSQQQRPAVVIAHAWNGRGEFVCQKARELAKLGYVGVALDLYGQGVVGQSVEENTKLMTPFMQDRSKIVQRLQLGIDQLAKVPVVDQSRVAAIGYCFGGLCVLDLARANVQLLAVVSFHGLLIPPDNYQPQQINPKVLVLHGYDDPMVPPEQVIAFCDEMTEVKADWQLHSYGNTVHAFTNPEANDPDLGTVYNQVADKRSWQTMTNFLEEIF